MPTDLPVRRMERRDTGVPSRWSSAERTEPHRVVVSEIWRRYPIRRKRSEGVQYCRYFLRMIGRRRSRMAGDRSRRGQCEETGA
jgi:hypothetical protein